MRTTPKALIAILNVVCLICVLFSIVACTPEVEDTKKYTVTFDLGEYDGEGTAPVAKTVDEDTAITLPEVGVTWEGHNFVGWKNGNDVLDVGENYTVTTNVTFTAQWQTKEDGKTEDDNKEDDSKENEYDWTSYVGMYVGLRNGVKYVITITETDVTVKIDGVSAEVTFTFGLNEYETYQFDLTINGEKYTLYRTDEYTDPTVEVSEIMLRNADSVYFSLFRTETEDFHPWETLIGKFKGRDMTGGDTYFIEITATDVTVSINGEPAEVTLVDYNSTLGFVLLINGEDFLLMEATYSPGTLVLTTTDSSKMALLEPTQDDEESDPDKGDGEDNAQSPIFDQNYAGTWTGSNLNDDVYTVEIESDAIYVTVNDGERIRAWILSYSADDDVYFKLGDDSTEYELYAYGNDSLWLMDDAFSVYVGLNRAQDDVEWNDNAMDPIFDQDYQGAWKGEDEYDDITYLIEIEEDAIYVTINNGARVRAWITRYYKPGQNDDVYFTLNGDENKEYELYTYTRDNTLVLVTTSYVDLTRVGEGGDEGDDPDDKTTTVYVGSYTAGGYEYVSFSLDLANKTVTYTYIVDGQTKISSAEISTLPSSYYPSNGYEGNKFDYTYYRVTLASSDEGTMYSLFVANDGSIMYLCDYMSDTIISTYNPVGAND